MNCQVLLEKSICLLSMNVTELKKLNRQPIIALGEFVGSSIYDDIICIPDVNRMYSITFPNLPFVQDQIRVRTSFYGRMYRKTDRQQQVETGNH